ncbi:MAG: ribonuclease III [Chloroflexi bacterium]|nr:ribonuclease III [Chloroflexota bacterium]
MAHTLTDIQRILDVRFKQPELLQEALTHRSFLNELPTNMGAPDNERLEFLGDAVLALTTAEYLYQRFRDLAEGPLTNLRAALVRQEALARIARQLNLGEYLYLGRGEDIGGGRNRPAILCATFEAVIGALYLDQGLEVAREFWLRYAIQELDRIQRTEGQRDSKSMLQEQSQGAWQLTPVYRTVSEQGPDHAKEFTVEVWIGERNLGRGTGHSKQSAEQVAAQAALESTLGTESAGLSTGASKKG